MAKREFQRFRWHEMGPEWMKTRVFHLLDPSATGAGLAALSPPSEIWIVKSVSKHPVNHIAVKKARGRMTSNC
jgi:hypothetical protein